MKGPQPGGQKEQFGEVQGSRGWGTGNRDDKQEGAGESWGGCQDETQWKRSFWSLGKKPRGDSDLDFGHEASENPSLL